jgi:hypothetical protein
VSQATALEQRGERKGAVRLGPLDCPSGSLRTALALLGAMKALIEGDPVQLAGLHHQPAGRWERVECRVSSGVSSIRSGSLLQALEHVEEVLERTCWRPVTCSVAITRDQVWMFKELLCDVDACSRAQRSAAAKRDK